MPRRRGLLTLGTLAALALSACGTAGGAHDATAPAAGTPSTARAAAPAVPSTTPVLTASAPTASAPTARSAAASSTATSARATASRDTPGPGTSDPSPSTASQASSVPAAGPRAAKDAPVIVIDPGHSVAVHSIDRATGLDVSDYENEPEMRDVWAVALRVRSALLAAGYRVVMTKTSLRQKVSLARRAQIANAAHAALALSIHDQAGADGGIGYRSGNNIVYYQSVGTYRATPSGKRVYFTNRSLAATSKKYGAIFAAQRRKVTGTAMRLQGNVGYNLGSRGLAAGNIWIVQLLSKVPWIYNEAGGNSSGRTGLGPKDTANYAAALVASVEHCLPLRS